MIERTFSWARYATLPREIHVVLFGTLLTRSAFFMIWPFLAIFLYQDYHLGATLIGTLLAVAMVGGALSSIYTGWLSDRFGRRRLILAGALLSALSFLLFIEAGSVFWFGVAVAGVSIGCSLLESTCKVLIGDYVEDLQSRELALYANYFLVNVGGSIGPLIGMLLLSSVRSLVFAVCALVYTVFGLLLWRLLRDKEARVQRHASAPTPNFLVAFGAVLKHRRFTLLMLCNTVAAFVYASFDSTLPQYLARSEVQDPVTLLVILITLNSLIVVFTQFPLLRLLEAYSTRCRLFWGMALMLASQLVFAGSPVTLFWGLALATLLLSVGELIVFPIFSIEVDRLAHESLRGTYFGVSSLYRVGIALSPIYGGGMLDLVGGQWMFIGLAALCGLVMVVQNYAVR